MILEEKFKLWLEAEEEKARKAAQNGDGYSCGRLDCIKDIQRLLEFDTSDDK